jgi:hypothetical protein
VQDPYAPDVVCQDITVTLGNDGTASISGEDIDGGSTDDCFIIFYTVDISEFTCDNIGENSVTLTAYDGAFRTASCVANVTVEEPSGGTIVCCDAPDAQCQNIEVSLDEDGTATITTDQIDNGSTAECNIASYLLDISTFDCDDIGENTVGLLVTDEQGNTGSCGATVTVVAASDLTANCQDISVQLDANGEASITADDIDNGSVAACGAIPTLSIDLSNFSCDDLGDNTVTLTADDSESTTTCTATVTVEDNIAPSANCQDITIELDANGNYTLANDALDNNSSDACGILTNSLSQNSLSCDDLGTLDITLTVTDVEGNTANCTATVTVEDNNTPTATCQDITVQLNANGEVSISPEDVDNNSATLCGNAVTLSLDQTDFDCDDLGGNTVTLTATNGNQTATCTANVTVEDDIAPTADCQDITVSLDITGSYSLANEEVDDNSNDACGISYSLSKSVLTCDDAGSVQITQTVTDPSGNTAECTATVTVLETIAPTASCQDYTAYLDENGAVSITPEDIDNGSDDNCAFSLSLDQTSFSCDEVGENTVSLTVLDENDNSSTCSATVTIVDNTVPTPSCQSITIQLDENGSATISAEDIDNGSDDNCTIASLSLTKTIFDCNDIESYNIDTLTVIDVNGNENSCIAIVTVQDNTAPTPMCQDITITLDENASASITPSSIDDGSYDNCAITSESISQTSFDCSHLGDNTVTLTLEDDQANTSSCTAIVSVQDNIEPTPICQDITIALDEEGYAEITPSSIDGGSYDNCGIITEDVSQNSFDCSNIGENTVILSLEDAELNISSCTAIVTVIDETMPTAVCQDIDIQLDENGTASITSDQIDNGSDDACGIDSYILSQTDFDCSHTGMNTVVLTVTDVNSNTSTCDATVEVLDEVSPSALCQDVTINLDNNGAASLSTDQVDNGSSDACGISSMELNQTTFDCTEVGENTITLTITDPSGNFSSCTATITVLDEVAPVAKCQDITIQLDENGTATISTDQIDNNSSDACGIASLSLNQTTFDCSNVGSNDVVLTVIDINNNLSTCEATVEVKDEILPIALCQDVTIQLDANGDASTTTQAIDNGSNDACVIASLSLNQTAFDCSHYGANTVTLTVTDVNGNSSTCSATVHVEDPIGPTVACLDPVIVFNGETGLDVDIDKLIDFNSYVDNCDILNIESPTSDINITCDQLGSTVTVTINVNDGHGNTASCDANIYVDGLPCNWTNTEGIGCVGDNLAEYDTNDGTFTITNDGCTPAYPYTADGMSFVTTELCGDGYIKALVSNIDGNGFAGIMLRNSLEEGAKKIAISTNGIDRVKKEARVLDNYPAWPQEVLSYDKIWLKIERTGFYFKAYASADDITYTPFIYQAIQMEN